MRSPAALILLATLAQRATAADPPAIDPSLFSVAIVQITLNRSLQFTDGDPARGSSFDQATVQLRLSYGGAQIVDIQPPRCDSVLTDAGEDLALPPDGDMAATRMLLVNQRRIANTVPGQRPSVPVLLAIRYPSKPAKTLAKLKATITVVCETAPGETVDLAPAADWVGRKRDIPGSEVGLTIMALSPLRYVCDEAVSEQKSVQTLAFLDAHGKEIQSGGWSSSGDGTRTTVTRNGLDLDPQGTVRLVLTGKTTKVQVPVDLADIPLQAPPLPPAAPLVFKTPAPPAVPPPAAKPGKSTDF